LYDNFEKKSFVYKKVDGLELLSDVYLPKSTQPEHEYATIVYFHGGGLVVGDRNPLGFEFINDLLNENWIYISFDYRLCPEVKIYDLWSDCEDHWKWVLTELPKLLNIKIDKSKIGSLGDSAGGYLALLSGYKLQPRPTVIVDYFGIVSIDSDYYNKPKENYPPELSISLEKYNQLLVPTPLSGCHALDPVTFAPLPRSYIFSYFVQEGLFSKTLWGLDIHNPDELKKLLEWHPAHNISKDYPPVIIQHGDKDIIIPISNSLEMIESLKKYGVEYQWTVATGHGHGFFVKKGGEEYKKYMTSALLWLKKYLK
jgi:acetyl esterase/lipase